MADETPLLLPFNAQDFTMSMAQQGKYACCLNLFQFSLTYSPSPGVPVNRAVAGPCGTRPKHAAHACCAVSNSSVNNRAKP